MGKSSVKRARDTRGNARPTRVVFFLNAQTLDRMVEKGVLAHEEAHGVKVFSPTVKKLNTIAGMMRDFASRVLEIDTALPVTAFADSKILSDEELEELQALLEEESEK